VTIALKVGALAKRTGLTVRTLHHYDEIGLLSPSNRTASGHRLYGQVELRRLQQIASLKQLGLPLDEIRDCLTRPDYSLEHVLSLQIDRIGEQIQEQEELRSVIESLRDRIRRGEAATVEELTRSIHVTVDYAKYYSPEQLESLAAKREEVGQDRMRTAQDEWMELFAAFDSAMERGLDPASPEVQALAAKSSALMLEFTGGDPKLTASLTQMYANEGADNVMSGHGVIMPPGLWEFMAAAREAG
jgi:DNA-binding transcriptional MerR regulator